MRKKILTCLMLFAVIMLFGCNAKESSDTTGLVVKDSLDIPEGSDAVAVIPAAPVEEVAEEELQESSEDLSEEVSQGASKEGKTHTVEVLETSFSPEILVIEVGETVVWENRRKGDFDKVMILGVRNCFDIKGPILSSGETFSWTFGEAETCTVVDGMVPTMQPIEITVLE